MIGAVEDMATALGIRVLAGLSKPLTSALIQKVISTALSRASSTTMPSHPKRPDKAEDLDAKALETAIHHGGITVHYQPKVDIQSGEVCGMEALARWHHGERGMIPPDRFIALAEREGLIYPLTLSVISQAFAQVSDWNAQGGKLRLTVAINLSPRLLDQDGLIDDIITLLGQHHLDASQITFEVTEGSLVSNLGAGLGLLTRLRLKGFGLSIDDYGTGFSSMQKLARIPFTELKIDRSFVHGAHARTNLKVILQSALDMAKQLDLITVAEGIETIEDWQLLKGFGCVIGQGYLIAKPMPASAVPAWLSGYRRRDLPTGVAT